MPESFKNNLYVLSFMLKHELISLKNYLYWKSILIIIEKEKSIQHNPPQIANV